MYYIKVLTKEGISSKREEGGGEIETRIIVTKQIKKDCSRQLIKLSEIRNANIFTAVELEEYRRLLSNELDRIAQKVCF